MQEGPALVTRLHTFISSINTCTRVVTTHTHSSCLYRKCHSKKLASEKGTVQSLRRKKLNFGTKQKGVCGLRGKIKPEGIWVLWAAMGGLSALWVGLVSSELGSRENFLPAPQRQSSPSELLGSWECNVSRAVHTIVCVWVCLCVCIVGKEDTP
jgi:hypothetical protein